jgi:hypothetical protein
MRHGFEADRLIEVRMLGNYDTDQFLGILGHLAR